MAKEYDRRNLDFILNEVFDTASLCNYPRYADYTPDMFTMVFDNPLQFSVTKGYPEFPEARP